MFKNLLLALLLLPLVALSQQTLKGNFAPDGGYQFGILYRIAPDNIFYVTDSNVDSVGNFELKMKEDLKPGMYRLVYNLPQDQHFFDFIFSGKEPIEFTFSKDETLEFTVSEENKIWKSFYTEMGANEVKIAKILSAEEVDNRNLKEEIEEQAKWYNEVSETSKGMTVHQFIAALKPYTNDDFKTARQYELKAKQDYLAHFDFNNPTLQNSMLPLERAIKYVYNFTDVENKEASRKYNIDDLITKLEETDPTYKKLLLTNFWNFLTSNNQVVHANYLAEKYLIPLAEQLQDATLANQLTLYKNLSIGAKAPNFTWLEIKDGKQTTMSLHQLDVADNYIIVFWSSLCSHCLKEVPLLHAKIASLEEGKFKVIAVGLEDFEAEWSPKAAGFNQFINVLGLGKWENDIGNRYDVNGTPTYFVLDKDKKIVAKPGTLDELFGIIDGE
ncbi:MAG: TlpA family protein disulfide reductase [Patiriisocius sp.]|uniref:TlpA family protein disulfide reductase n=1 Tax=Patiriisocius sp. TaxID=2822396 RepID=UPI003EF26276